uniref:Uncharacterized protein n=1 Tax=Romanomermis culicivorax TaxID=13658 RepID=A0A915HGW4_ROMCU
MPEYLEIVRYVLNLKKHFLQSKFFTIRVKAVPTMKTAAEKMGETAERPLANITMLAPSDINDVARKTNDDAILYTAMLL